LTRQTKTLKFYRSKADPRKVLLGVRGTADLRDMAANAHLVVGALKHSKRYKADKAEVEEYLRAHPDAEIRTASHSLGGAVARGLARDFSAIKGGTAFNSAIGLDELLVRKKLGNVKQTRVSTQRDFLRLLAKPFLRKSAHVVIPGRPTVVGSHSLSNFDATNSGA
jgi:alpha-beta hydrolase superfamily lysophospholipase